MAPEGRSILEVACASSTVKKTKKFIAKPPQNYKSLAQRPIHWKITASTLFTKAHIAFQKWERNKPLDMLILTVRLEHNCKVLEYDLSLDTVLHNIMNFERPAWKLTDGSSYQCNRKFYSTGVK